MNKLTDFYPFNLALDIFGSEEIINEIYINGLLEALTTLTDREQRILKCRYEDKLTLEQVAKSENVTRERIRQIQTKALTKLRHPYRKGKIIAVSMDKILEKETEYSNLYKEYEFLKQDYLEITQKKSVPIWLTPIEELDFSVRAYNCLKRHGINTLKDITKMTEMDLMKVRNMGKHTAEEIKRKLEEYGLSLQEVANGEH